MTFTCASRRLCTTRSKVLSSKEDMDLEKEEVAKIAKENRSPELDNLFSKEVPMCSSRNCSIAPETRVLPLEILRHQTQESSPNPRSFL